MQSFCFVFEIKFKFDTTYMEHKRVCGDEYNENKKKKLSEGKI